MRRVPRHRRRHPVRPKRLGHGSERRPTMKPFDYTVPSSLDDAIRSGAQPATRFIAGGTTLVDLMKLEVETPAHLVDLNPLGDSDHALSAVTELPGGGLRIGALARLSDVAWDARVKDAYP